MYSKFQHVPVHSKNILTTNTCNTITCIHALAVYNSTARFRKISQGNYYSVFSNNTAMMIYVDDINHRNAYNHTYIHK